MFGPNGARPFEPSTLPRRALAAWERVGLGPIGLHEARHTFASLMISAGVNAKAALELHGPLVGDDHRYGHLMQGNEAEAAELLDGYLARAAGGER